MKNTYKSKLIVALILVLILMAGCLLLKDQILNRVVQVAVKHRLTNSNIVNLPDGLHVGLCGAGGQFLVDPKRSEPCTLVLAGTTLFVIDVGNKSTQNIEAMGFGAGEVKTILLTHFHSDHINGLGQLLNWNWMLSKNSEQLPVFGPEGIKIVVDSINAAYSFDKKYKVLQLSEKTLSENSFGGRSITLNFHSKDQILNIYKSQDLEIDAFPVDHPSTHPSLGYIFRYKDRSVLISGDTLKSKNIIKYGKNIDLLVHDAVSPTLMKNYEEGALKSGMSNVADIFSAVSLQHATPENAASTALETNAKYLLLTGITPPLQLPGSEGIFLGKASEIYKGPIKVGADGDLITMPANTKIFEYKNILSRF